MPGQAGERLGVGAQREPEAGDLDEPAGDDRRHRVVAEPAALGDADRERDDVLRRAAQLDPDDVGVRVRPEVGRRARARDERSRSPRRPRRPRWPSAAARRSPARGSARRRRRPARSRGPSASATTWLIRRSDVSSTPFISETATAPGGTWSASGSRVARALCDGIATTTRSAPSSTATASVDARRARRAARCPAGTPRCGARARCPGTRSARRPHSATSHPASASTAANVVPHAPVPRTAARSPVTRAPARWRGVAVGPGGAVVVRCGRRRPDDGVVVGRDRLARPGGGAAHVERTAGALPPRTPSSSSGDGRHDALGRLAQGRGVQRAPVEVVEVDRRAGDDRHLLARERLEDLLVLAEEVLRSPLGDRDHRRLRGEREPRDAGLADHRPQVRVAGERALGEDRDALAVRDRLDRGPQGVARPARCCGRPGSGRSPAGPGRAPAPRTATTSPGSSARRRGRTGSARTSAGRRSSCGCRRR